MTKPFLRALAGETVTPVPYWMMRQAGRYLPEYREIRKTAKNFLDFCYTPDKAEAVTLQPLKRYDFSAAILFSDILVIPDALGQKVEFREGEGPVLEPVRTEEELAKLSKDNLHQHLEPVYQTMNRLSKSIPDTTAMIGFSGAPWTVATYMVEGRSSKDYALTKSVAYGQEDFFQRMIDLLVDATSEYLIEQINRGAETIQIFDSWAGVLSESAFERWVIDPNRRLVEAIKAVHPNIPVIGFPRGAGVLYERFVKETGVDGVSLDQTVPVRWAADHLQPHCTVQGNLDNQLLVVGGERMISEARSILDVLAKGPFIFNLGHGIVPQTPPENVGVLVDFLKNWKPG